MPDAVLSGTVLPDTVPPDTVLPNTVLPNTVLPNTVLPDTVLPATVPPHASPALYPTPRTVRTTSGFSGSRSTLERSRWTWTLTSRVSAAWR